MDFINLDRRRFLATGAGAAINLSAQAPKKRVAFLLYTLDDYSIEEVAALTGASKSATKSRIWFARCELLAMVRDRADLNALLPRDAKEVE